MGELPNWQVYGVPAALIIVSVINWLKESFDLESKWAFPVATVIGLVIGGMLYLSDVYTWALAVTQILFGGVLLGLSASGYYSMTKSNYIRTMEKGLEEESKGMEG